MAAALLLPLSLLHLSMAFGTEAVGFSYLTSPGLVDAATATDHLQALSEGGHYGVLIGTGLLACTLGEAAAVRVLAACAELPVLLRRLLPVAVVLDLVEVTVPLPLEGALAITSAAIWVGLGGRCSGRCDRRTAWARAEADGAGRGPAVTALPRERRRRRPPVGTTAVRDAAARGERRSGPLGAVGP